MDTMTAGQCQNWYRSVIRGKTRIVVAWIFVIILGFSAKQYPTWPGVLLCFIGALIRFWASGYLRKDLRPAVGGPYAFVRNPLYLGTYLMALGSVLAIEDRVLLVLVSTVFAAIYHFIILDEETKLERIFKEPYLEYCQKVPRFFPRLWPPFFPASREVCLKINPEKSHLSFSSSLAMKNRAYEALLSFVGLMVFILVAAYFWQHI